MEICFCRYVSDSATAAPLTLSMLEVMLHLYMNIEFFCFTSFMLVLISFIKCI